MPRRLLLLVVAALALVGLDALPAAAQSGESITGFDVTVEVGSGGELRVHERITYDFGADSRHGIFRVIPDHFVYEPDTAYDRVTPIEDVSVSSDTAPDGVSLGRDGRFLTIRIGDPDRLITGVHTYEITYRVRGAVNAFPDHDELYWNTTGSSWEVPIRDATVQVLLPAAPTAVTCFAGPTGSNFPCPRADTSTTTAAFGASGLGPGEGLTVVVGLPAGTIQPPPAPILEERWSLARAFRPSTASIGLLVLGLVGVGALVRWVFRAGRDRRWRGGAVAAAFGPPRAAIGAAPAAGGGHGDEHHEIVPLFGEHEIPVLFEPPDDLRPGLLGTLVDERAEPLDVTGTVVDLAVRGHLRIEEIPGTGLFGKDDWRLVALGAPTDDLLPYERTLLASLFEDAEGTPPSILISDLRDHFAEEMSEVQKLLYREVVDRRWFDRRPDDTRTTWLVLGIVALVAAGVAGYFAISRTTLGLSVIPLVLAGLVLLAAGPRMPRRTATGRAALIRTLGFRRFIDESEVHRARFAEEQHLFTEYLPYAIVFGATEKWAKAFAGLEGASPDVGTWYVGTRPFAYQSFAGSMRSFAVSTAGSLSSVPAGSGGSGFGGGGFSGGGFGGGGGGSW